MDPAEVDSTNAISLSIHKRQADGSFSGALDLTDSGTKLYTGDRVRLTYRAPFESYVYIINFSNSGGTALVYPRRPELNSPIAANSEKSFLFDLTNRENVQGAVTEEAVVIVTRQRVDTPNLNDLLRNYSKHDELTKSARVRSLTEQEKRELRDLAAKILLPRLPQSELISTVYQQVTEKQSKKKIISSVIRKLGCGALSVWLGGLFGAGCNAVAGRLSAMEPVEDDISNVVYAKAGTTDEKMYMRLAFQHTAR